MQKSVVMVWLACAGMGVATPLSAGWVSNEEADFILGDARLPDPWTLRNPSDVDVDATSGKVFVVDAGHHRVLRFDAPASGNNLSANAVLGQPDFDSTGREYGPSVVGMASSLAIGADGTLYVGDGIGRRVLRWKNAGTLSNGAPADGVLGRKDFTSTAEYGNSPSEWIGGVSRMCLDGEGRLWVADMTYNRVLRFDNAAQLTNTAPASGVLGTAVLNKVPVDGRTRRVFRRPMGVSLDANESLWVADVNNARLLRFTPDSLATVEAMERTAAGVWRLRFSTQGAGTFTVQSSTDLKVWTDEAAYKLGAGVSQWHERPADGVSRFFRIYEP